MPDPATHSLMTFKDLVHLELRPDLDFVTVQALGKPTWVTRGIFGGFSLPIYSADNEELFFEICAPDRWDANNNVEGHVDCWLSGTEDSKNFKLQLSWEHYTTGDTVPATSADVEVEIATGASAPQFKSFQVEMPLTIGDLARDDIIGLRLRRIAASANEVGGEIVICHLGIIFPRNTLGEPV